VAVVRFNHFNVCVSDMDRSLPFWMDGLGLQLMGRGIVEYDHLDRIVGLNDTRIEWAELALPGGGIIELFRYHNPAADSIDASVNRPGATHFAIEVDDIEAQFKQLRAYGFVDEQATITRIPFGDWENWLCAYVRDADGVTIELLQRPQ
jgi:catechol 2,3-dioxygenase-like lactoylglutathione lyase family enzyme